MQMQPLRCQACGTTFNGESPEPVILNNHDACVIVIHPQPAVCPNMECRAEYLPVIGQAQLSYAWPRVQPKTNGSGIIVPGIMTATMR